MIQGIPFFGEQHNELAKLILNARATSHIDYLTVFDMIKAEAFKHTVVIIDNKWFTWLHDIRFNYRDDIVELPYFTYEIYETEMRQNQTDNKGHLILDKENKTVLLRHNYNLQMLSITPDTELTLVDLSDLSKYTVKASKWYYSIFDINDLYIKYINSAYYDFDELLEKHIGGYHYITRQFKGFVNAEHKKRNMLELNSYKEKMIIPEDYRDVRQYRRQELFGDTFIETVIPYKFRRLLFDSMLCCIIKQHSVTTDPVFNFRYSRLSKEQCILSYTPDNCSVPLIFKSYWYGIGDYKDKRAIRKHV